jgi:septal ring factor EnvC (AmiA/AmiB activator)
MNMPVIKEGTSFTVAISVAAFSAVASLIVVIFGAQINARNSELQQQSMAQSAELRQHDLDIAQLKISDANKTDEMRRTENSITAIEQTQSTIIGKLQSLQDSNDAQTGVSTNIKDQLLDLRKQLGDLDLILRPIRGSNPH